MSCENVRKKLVLTILKLLYIINCMYTLSPPLSLYFVHSSKQLETLFLFSKKTTKTNTKDSWLVKKLVVGCQKILSKFTY